MTKFLALAALLAVFAATLTSGVRSTQAAGPICAVPGDYATIGAAVADPGCATINVAAGSYNENVTIARSLTLKGAQAGNAVAGRTAGGPLESTVVGVTPVGNVAVLTISAANVTVDGFSVKNVVSGGAAMGVTVSGAGANAVIIRNIVDTISTPDTGGNGTAQAVYLTAGGADGVSITGNRFSNVSSNRSAKGVLIGDNGGTNPSQNTVIQGNTITGITSTTRGAYGVSVASVPNVSGLQVTGNTIQNLTGGGWAHAIGLEGDTPGVVVSSNTISGLTDLTPTVPADVIAVWFESNPSFSSGQVHDNNFNMGSSAFGIAVHPALSGSPVNGSCNWWGAANGPGPVATGSGAQVGPNVTYAPWLTSLAPSPCNGAVVTDKDQCKNDGWKTLFRANGTSFKNQGDCIQYVNTGK